MYQNNMNGNNSLCSSATFTSTLWFFIVIASVHIVLAELSTVVVTCAKSYYLSNGSCHPCPDRCITCISPDSCNRCQHGFYGKACRSTCEQCSGQCHKEYGHCTLGCPDGQYPDPNSRSACLYCKDRCSLCSSDSHCVKCEDGFFGKTCDQRCSALCVDKLCYISGECLNCRTGHYKSDGVCLKCPVGCAICAHQTECSECQEGYLGPYHGICLRKCPVESRTLYYISRDQCICSSKCDEKCKIDGFCINDSIATDRNDKQYFRDNMCGIIMSLTCIYTCTPCVNDNDIVCNENYKCVEKCALSLPHGPFGSTMCRHNISTEVTESTTIVQCVTDPQSVSSAEVQGWVIAVIISLVIGIGLGCCIFCWRYKLRQGPGKDAASNIQEGCKLTGGATESKTAGNATNADTNHEHTEDHSGATPGDGSNFVTSEGDIGHEATKYRSDDTYGHARNVEAYKDDIVDLHVKSGSDVIHDVKTNVESSRDIKLHRQDNSNICVANPGAGTKFVTSEGDKRHDATRYRSGVAYGDARNVEACKDVDSQTKFHSDIINDVKTNVESPRDINLHRQDNVEACKDVDSHTKIHSDVINDDETNVESSKGGILHQQDNSNGGVTGEDRRSSIKSYNNDIPLEQCESNSGVTVGDDTKVAELKDNLSPEQIEQRLENWKERRRNKLSKFYKR